MNLDTMADMIFSWRLAALLLSIRAAAAQNPTSASVGSVPASTNMPTASPASTSAQTTTATPITDNPEITLGPSDPNYLRYINQGMKPAAASYMAKQQYATNSRGVAQQAIDDIAIGSFLQSALPTTDFPHVENDLVHASVEAYFISLLPTEDRAYESSFVSKWFSYQQITLDPAESTRLHGLADARLASTTSSSTAVAASCVPYPIGALAGALVGLAGVL